MKNQKIAILENMNEAISMARERRQPMYVFYSDGYWCFSGKLPIEADYFYIAYPNGNMDQSGKAPYITNEEWQDYWLMYTPKFNLPQALGPKPPKESWIMTNFKKIFSGYCAFAPFIALAMTFILSHFTQINDFWKFAIAICMVTIPMSVIFVLIGLIKARSTKIAIVATTLASDGHLLFYASLWALEKQMYNSDLMVITLVASMLMAGAALLLIWDNEEDDSLTD